MDAALTEWALLGIRLRQLCPDKFDEIVDCLRETVSAHEILAPVSWTFAAGESRIVAIAKP